MEDTLDPEIAALLGNSQGESSDVGEIEDLPIEEYTPDTIPTNRKSLFSKSVDEVVNTVKSRSIHEVDLTQKGFDVIENPLSSTPTQIFNDQKYYKIALTGENQSAQRVHQLLTKYLTCQDPKDRAVFRQQIVTAYWELLRGMVGKMVDPGTPMPKRMMVRYGVILPSLFKQETKEFFSKINIDNKTGEPVLYVDEWFKEIASGRMNNSATDEKKQVKAANMTPDQAASAEQARLMQLQSKNSGKMQSSENVLAMKENERQMLETELFNNIKELCAHQPLMGYEPHTAAYTEIQRKQLPVITDLLHRLSKNDKELSRALEDFKEAKTTYDNVQNKISAGGGATLSTNDTEAVKIEYETVRQMAKMTIGRRGNQFPIFTREFYHCTERGTGTRENVLEVLRWIESIDPGVFHRIHKNIPNRIVPYVLLVPTYGDRGFCWEPFDRYNRVTSRGRIVVPMYPKDLTIAVLTAVADLRWQVAKEKASYYWMEEGLTGQYYQHFDQMKLKGDVKEFFIEDYILWMTKESTGVQRLDKDVRGIFWRNMPYPKELKEDLRKRSLVYDELCKKDANREMSDGY
ncbi:MAG: hypothetical protein J6J00_02965 [Treponema sp.]|nr:hypothetical protein [Treponema sp.]